MINKLFWNRSSNAQTDVYNQNFYNTSSPPIFFFVFLSRLVSGAGCESYEGLDGGGVGGYGIL